MYTENTTSVQRNRKLMVLEKFSADGAKTPLFLDALGNELYQVGHLLTCQVAKGKQGDSIKIWFPRENHNEVT